MSTEPRKPQPTPIELAREQRRLAQLRAVTPLHERRAAIAAEEARTEDDDDPKEAA